MKKSLVFAIVFIWNGAVFGISAPAPKGVAVLVVPARYSVLQVAFDAADRMGAVLVSYQASQRSSSPVLDYWADREWQRISVSNYQNGGFVRGRVSQIILVGTDEMIPQDLVVASASLSPDVQRVTSLDTPGLINALGKIFRFSSSDWLWFSRRYNLQLSDRNAERRTLSWYDRSSYGDKWSERWQWLRRKHNPPHATMENEAPVETRTDAPSATAGAGDNTAQYPSNSVNGATKPVTQSTGTQDSFNAELTAPVERLDVPLVEPEGIDIQTPSDHEPTAPRESEEDIEAQPYPIK